MGGSVAVILKHNNKITKMCRRTGVYQSLLFDKRLHGDALEQKKAVSSFVKIFKDMRQDYLKGPPYQHNMTNVYGDYDSCVPSGYGMVFIDIDKKEVHSLQSYDSPGELSFFNLESQIQDKKERENLAYFFKNNKLTVYDHMTKNKQNIKDFFGTQDSQEIFERFEFRKKIEKSKYIKKTLDIPSELQNVPFFKIEDKFTFYLQLNEWTLKRYKEQNLKSLLELYKVMGQSIAFTEKDKESWLAWYSDSFSLEDYEDDKSQFMEQQNMSKAKIQAYIDYQVEKLKNEFKSSLDIALPKSPAQVIEIKAKTIKTLTGSKPKM